MSQSVPLPAGPCIAADAGFARDRPLQGIDEETRLFWRMRTRQTFNSLVRSAESSRLRLSLVVLLTALLWTLLFVLFADGFRFLNLSVPETATHDETVRAVYSLFFASLMVLLVFSNGIIIYSALYSGADVRFLLSTPTRDERIFVHKFQESIVLSSWVFLLLCSPMLIAYGMVEGAGWFYFAAVIPFLLAFAFIPGAWGACAAMIVVRRLPASRVQFLWFAASAVVLTGLLLSWLFASDLGGDMMTPAWFQEALARVKMSEYRLLPSWWLSSGLLESVHAHWSDPAGRRALTECLMFLALLVSNALLFHLVAVWIARRMFRTGYLMLQGEQTARRPLRLTWLDNALLRAPLPLPQVVRLLLVKDLRLFRRDPVQWSQIAIFCMLLMLYFLNTRKLTYSVTYAGWIGMISFLNLAVIGLILSTFTTRFVYPMLSLEGRRFWVLGLLPVRRETILWGKYVFATLGSLGPLLLLVILSDLMLGVPRLVFALHVGAAFLLCSGLSAIAVGLGAIMPNLRHDSPSRISAGFGGTMTLVVSTVFILATVLLIAVPCHFYFALSEGVASRHAPAAEALRWVAAGAGASLLLGVLATALPLWMGLRAFRKLEF